MALTQTAQTKPKLLGINSDEPVLVVEHGLAYDGIIWVVQPEDFDNVVEMVNKFGSPNIWRITKLSELTDEQVEIVSKKIPDHMELINQYR